MMISEDWANQIPANMEWLCASMSVKQCELGQKEAVRVRTSLSAIDIISLGEWKFETRENKQ